MLRFRSLKKRMLPYLLLVVVFLLVGRYGISRRIAFPGSPVAFPAGSACVQEYRAKDGQVLRGGWFPVAGDGPVVVSFHGNAESAAQNEDLGRALQARGFSTFLAEFRGYAGLDGTPGEDGLLEDGRGAVAHVLSLGVAPSRLVLVGRSLGTGVATALAAEGHGRALVLVSPYTSLVDVGWGLVGPLAPLVVRDRFDSLARIARVSVPVVVIHGTADTVIPFALGKRLCEAAPRGRFVPLDGVGHNGIPGLPSLLAREVAAVTSSG